MTAFYSLLTIAVSIPSSIANHVHAVSALRPELSIPYLFALESRPSTHYRKGRGAVGNMTALESI